MLLPKNRDLFIQLCLSHPPSSCHENDAVAPAISKNIICRLYLCSLRLQIKISNFGKRHRGCRSTYIWYPAVIPLLSPLLPVAACIAPPVAVRKEVRAADQVRDVYIRQLPLLGDFSPSHFVPTCLRDRSSSIKRCKLPFCAYETASEDGMQSENKQQAGNVGRNFSLFLCATNAIRRGTQRTSN